MSHRGLCLLVLSSGPCWGSWLCVRGCVDCQVSHPPPSASCCAAYSRCPCGDATCTCPRTWRSNLSPWPLWLYWLPTAPAAASQKVPPHASSEQPLSNLCYYCWCERCCCCVVCCCCGWRTCRFFRKAKALMLHTLVSVLMMQVPKL